MTFRALLPPLMPAPTATPRHDSALDGARGLAAVCVLLAHLTHPLSSPDPRWSPAAAHGWFPASAAVLLFFVLSGYVIGLAVNASATSAGVRDYLARRALRLWPINTIAVLLAVAAGGFPGWDALSSNLVFLQNALPYFSTTMPMLGANPNLWSLNYEVCYYLGFLLLWICRPSMALVFPFLFIVGVGGWWTDAFPRFIAAYACGALFWIAGLALAWLAPRERSGAPGAWPTAMIVAWLTWQWQFLPHDLARVAAPVVEGVWVSPANLELLPALVWLMAAITRRQHPAISMLKWTALGWLAVHVLWRIGRGLPWVNEQLGFLALFLMALALLRWRPNPRALERCAPLGFIAYAIYAISWPIHTGLRQCWPAFSGSATTYAIRATVAIGLIVVLAWLLERKLQPQLRRALHRPERPETAPAAVAP